LSCSDDLIVRKPATRIRRSRLAHVLSRALLLSSAFIVFAVAIMAEPSKRLTDFDQSFYITIAYDIERHGVFSSGIFDDIDSTRHLPRPGMFFVPGYPLLVLTAMRIDPRFADAVRCSVEANHGVRSESECEDYSRPVHLIHALLLAIAVLAIALAAELIVGGLFAFWLAGALAALSLVAHAPLFSFIMTESATVAPYAVMTLFALRAWQTGRLRYYVLTGLVLGLLCLIRPSFLVLLPFILLASLLHGLWLVRRSARQVLSAAATMVFAFMVVVGPWIGRNYTSMGKAGLTEEYGSAALIERFAYNGMTAMELIGAFPYCVPGIGDLAFDKIDGNDFMRRFLYHTPDSIFHLGRGQREALLRQHGRLDPIISQVFKEEMRTNGWSHILVSVPLAWCGMWVGSLWSLALVPIFAWACVRAARQSQPLLLLYAAPAVAMLGLHALVANHYTRYNLILIGPYCVAAAWLIHSIVVHGRSRWRARGPAP
jgi:4-amino-4-deoxy-L-arabinose transferase-like glycosyltransferase